MIEYGYGNEADDVSIQRRYTIATSVEMATPNSLLATYKARSCVETARKVLSLTKSSAASVPEVRRLLNCLETDGRFLSNVAKQQIEELEGEEDNLQCEMREAHDMKTRHELDKQGLEEHRSDMESSRVQQEEVLEYDKFKKKGAEDRLCVATANLEKEQKMKDVRLAESMIGGAVAVLTGAGAGAGAGVGVGAGIGAVVGIIGGPIGVAFGAVVGATAGGIAGGVFGTKIGINIAAKTPNPMGKLKEAKGHYEYCCGEAHKAGHKLKYDETSLESLKTEIQSCNTLIWNAERRAAQAHEKIGAIKQSITFMREAVYMWDLLKNLSQNATANTRHLQKIVQIADETKTYQIITSDGTTIKARSFLQAWEKVSSIRNLHIVLK